MISSENRYFICLAGLPATMEYGATSLVTTAPAATTAPSPIFTPRMMVAFIPIQTSFPIIVFFATYD